MPDKEPAKPTRGSRPASASASSEDYPVTSSYAGHHPGDYSYVELVSDIQNRLGRLTEAVESLKVQSKDQAQELRDIAKDVHAFKFGLRIIGAVLVLASAIIGFLLNHIAEIVQAYFTAKK